ERDLTREASSPESLVAWWALGAQRCPRCRKRNVRPLEVSDLSERALAGDEAVIWEMDRLRRAYASCPRPRDSR
ncbi:hypothetical protein V1514DRAFT_322934, partial [Lipomyces japonicus]|uniref:uncharacterized protein n=1 Tax=Lipomyces japonicus TaxID=56871 RepID=UPI0034CF36AE